MLGQMPASAVALLFILTFIGVIVIVGVVLPAVWSRRAYRRNAARAVLGMLVQALPRRRWGGVEASAEAERTPITVSEAP